MTGVQTCALPICLVPLDSARREAAIAALARLIAKLLTSGRGAPGEATGDIDNTDAEQPDGHLTAPPESR